MTLDTTKLEEQAGPRVTRPEDIIGAWRLDSVTGPDDEWPGVPRYWFQGRTLCGGFAAARTGAGAFAGTLRPRPEGWQWERQLSTIPLMRHAIEGVLTWSDDAMCRFSPEGQIQVWRRVGPCLRDDAAIRFQSMQGPEEAWLFRIAGLRMAAYGQPGDSHVGFRLTGRCPVHDRRFDVAGLRVPDWIETWRPDDAPPEGWSLATMELLG